MPMDSDLSTTDTTNSFSCPSYDHVASEMEATCLELALEGERLCKTGDCRLGIQFFQSAVEVGTDDLKTLSAIYSQIGNAYFYLQEHSKALEYHKLDLNLTRSMCDKVGEAKASGNLGNTLKVLGKFDEAVVCCLRHLDITREMNDRVGEARALYNLGNVYHAKGKHIGRSVHQDPGDFPPQVKEALKKAAEYYEENLAIVRELRDRAAQGRACGNLGNTHYLLGNFHEAVRFHMERLAIAKEFGDRSAERRAYSNLGNAHVFLAEFDTATENYKNSLSIARQLGDKALEAQACYSLGNTYTLLRDYNRAIEFHLRHLHIAQELADRVGEGRACWSLGNAYTVLNQHHQALSYAQRHLHISKEVGDETGKATAQMNVSDLRQLLGMSESDTSGVGLDANGDTAASESLSNDSLLPRASMKHIELVKNTSDKEIDFSDGGPCMNASSISMALRKSSDGMSIGTAVAPTTEASDEETFFSLLSHFQSRRMDEQRCAFNSSVPADNIGANSRAEDALISAAAQEAFLDMVAGVQGQRMNDQRAALPQFPGLKASPSVFGRLLNGKENKMPDDTFFEMLMRCQATRIDDQRSSLPDPLLRAPTVPDEDFFNLIQRVQSNRLEEQRCVGPTNLTVGPTVDQDLLAQQELLRKNSQKSNRGSFKNKLVRKKKS